MEDMSLEINIGTLKSPFAKLQFKFIVHSSGSAHLQIYASDPSDLRKSGVLFTLDESQYDQLKELINLTDQTIEKLRTAGQMKSMVVKLR